MRRLKQALAKLIKTLYPSITQLHTALTKDNQRHGLETQAKFLM